MKRSSNDYGGGGRGRGGGGGNKRGRFDSYQEAIAAGKYELRTLLTSRGAGAVIGKGGENIKRLRSEFDAHLTVPDSQTPERILTITAKAENILNCLREIIPRLDENRGNDRDRTNRNEKGESELRILVHESHAGAIIGRGGSRIKELREKTGVQLKVFSHCAPQSTERIVLIDGAQEKIVDCTNAIIEILKEIPIKGLVRPYDTLYYDPDIVTDYGGYMADRGFRGVNRMGRGMNAFEGDMRMGNRGGGGGGGGGGGYRYSSPPLMPRDNYRGGGGGGGGAMREPMGRYRSPVRELPTTTQVTIPDELGGAIIGKGGSRINKVRQESGAQVEVEPQRGRGDDRIITITGSREQIQAAQYLLQQCVRSSEAGRRYLSER